MGLIRERVELARAGKNETVVCRLKSGWVVMGDAQPLLGYCLLLADPVVPTLNDLSLEQRTDFLLEMSLVGDAVLKVTGAARINYSMLGNLVPELHAHVMPRFEDEDEKLRTKPPFFYDWDNSVKFTEECHGHLRLAIAKELEPYRQQVGLEG